MNFTAFGTHIEEINILFETDIECIINIYINNFIIHILGATIYGVYIN